MEKVYLDANVIIIIKNELKTTGKSILYELISSAKKIEKIQVFYSLTTLQELFNGNLSNEELELIKDLTDHNFITINKEFTKQDPFNLYTKFEPQLLFFKNNWKEETKESKEQIEKHEEIKYKSEESFNSFKKIL